MMSVELLQYDPVIPAVDLSPMAHGKKRAAKFFGKFSDDEPRDAHGEWTSGGGESSQDSGFKIVRRGVPEDSPRHDPPKDMQTGKSFSVLAYHASDTGEIKSGAGGTFFSAEPDTSYGKNIFEVNLQFNNPFVYEDISEPSEALLTLKEQKKVGRLFESDDVDDAENKAQTMFAVAAVRHGYDGLIQTGSSGAKGDILYQVLPQKKKVSKLSHGDDRKLIHPGRLTPSSILAKHRLEKVLQNSFGKMRRKVVRSLRREAGIAAKALLAKLRKFDSVQFNLDPKDAEKVINIPADVNDLDVKGRDYFPHATVLFGFDGVSFSDVEELTRGSGDCPVTLGELFCFPAGDHGCPLVILLKSEKLVALHDKLEVLPHFDSHNDYVPHICVAYLKPEAAEKYVGQDYAGKGSTIVLNDLVFSQRDKTVLPLAKFAKAADDSTQQLLNSLATEWENLAKAALLPLTEASTSGADLGALQLDITGDDMLANVNTVAREWAADRAAELVGMQFDDDNNLIPNPDARWAISDTTREKLRDAIARVFAEEKPTLKDIEDAVMDSGVFEDTRATMIARTEIARAQVQGNLDAWKTSGLVEEVNWILSDSHDDDDICNENEEGSPYELGDEPEFPAHVNCMCSIGLGRLKGEPKEDE
jgi:hypothetical protein